MHDKAAGLSLLDTPRLQVEQLLGVETASGGRVSGAANIAGLDLQVWYRVGTTALGEDEILV